MPVMALTTLRVLTHLILTNCVSGAVVRSSGILSVQTCSEAGISLLLPARAGEPQSSHLPEVAKLIGLSQECQARNTFPTTVPSYLQPLGATAVAKLTDRCTGNVRLLLLKAL